MQNILAYSLQIDNKLDWNKHISTLLLEVNHNYPSLTLYDPGREGGFKSPPPVRFFALTHLILGLHYCALGTFPKI